MTFKEWFINFKLDMKKFIWYIVTEPFRIVLQGVFFIKKSVSLIQKVRAWMYIFITASAVLIVFHQIDLAKFTLALFIISLLYHEYERGFFRKRWKDKEHKRAEKYLKRNIEVKKDEFSNSVEQQRNVRDGESNDRVGSVLGSVYSVPDGKKDLEMDTSKENTKSCTDTTSPVEVTSTEKTSAK